MILKKIIFSIAWPGLIGLLLIFPIFPQDSGLDSLLLPQEEVSWSDWVDRLIGEVETDEQLEEIAPSLLRLERWYHNPRDVNSLTAADLEAFFWLSPGEIRDFLDFRKTNTFTSLEEIFSRRIFTEDNYSQTTPFLKVKKATQEYRNPTVISYGIALRSKELVELGDFPELFKNYQIKVFGDFRQAGVGGVHYLIERDPNEFRIADLSKWSFTLNLPLSSGNGAAYPDPRLSLVGGALSIKIHQSLLMSTGYPLRKNERAPYTLKRNVSRIKEDTSSQEIFLQGLAADYVIGDWRIGTWAGQVRYDDPILTNTADPLQTYAEGYSFYSSLHRPFPDFTLTENLIGFIVERKIGYHTLSAAFLYSRFSHPLITSKPDRFYGQSHWGISSGWDLDFNRFRWYGEAVFLMNEVREDPWKNLNGNPNYRGSGALTTGGRLFFPESDLFLSFRLIPQDYQAVHNLAYARYTGNDEVGILGGYRLKPFPRFTAVTSFDFFRQLSMNDPLKFGVDLSETLSYNHLSGYYNETQVRLRERGEWEDDYNRFWELRHRSGWKNRSWLFFAESKLSGSLIKEIIADSHPFGLLLSIHGEYRYGKASTTVWEALWSRRGPIPIYDSIYHSRFFNDVLYLGRDAFLVFFRQSFKFHPLLQTGFSLGFYWDDSEGKLFQQTRPNKVMFSFYVNGETDN